MEDKDEKFMCNFILSDENIILIGNDHYQILVDPNAQIV